MLFRRILILFIIINCFTISLHSQAFSISGIVKDAQTGGTLIGVNVYILNTTEGITTNNYGYYSLKVKPAQYKICYSYMGYQTYIDTVVVTGNLTRNISLKSSLTNLTDVTITRNIHVNSTNISKINLNIAQLKRIPGMTGEPDLVKGLQFIPGVQTSNEGTTNINVRGGSNDQNLFLLDEAPVYNASHALGFYSVFNTDAIKSVDFYKGGFPAQYGGRMSSVVDITMKEGSLKDFETTGSTGVTASRITIEGPIINDKLSFLISGRYSYVGEAANLFAGKIGHDLLNISSLNNYSSSNDISFYDFNVKLNYVINKNNRIYLSAYSGADHFLSYALNGNNIMDWGNQTATLRWNHLFNQSTFSNTTVYYSKYRYSYQIDEDVRNFIWKSNLNEVGVKHDITSYFNLHNTIRTGVSVVYHYFSPGTLSKKNEQSAIKPLSLKNQDAFEISSYLSNDQKISQNVSINYGLRYSSYTIVGPGTLNYYNSSMDIVSNTKEYSKGEIMKFYQGVEPRVNLCYAINEANSVKASYSLVKQYLHQLSNSSIGLPTDTWVSPNNYIPPESAKQFILGYYTSIPHNNIDFSLEGYYKILDNIIDYKDNADLFMNSKIEQQILIGKGKSYGIEFLIEKKQGKFNGWASYCISETKYKIDGINQNNWFHPRYDIRHNFSIVANYNLSQSWSLSTNFKLSSGGYVTLPEGTFVYHNVAFPYYTIRNGYALPLYHRLDLSVVYSSPKNITRRWKSQWEFSIYNIYFHKNVYALYVKQDDYNTNSNNIYYMYLFGIVPTINYNFKF